MCFCFPSPQGIVRSNLKLHTEFNFNYFSKKSSVSLCYIRSDSLCGSAETCLKINGREDCVFHFTSWNGYFLKYKIFHWISSKKQIQRKVKQDFKKYKSDKEGEWFWKIKGKRWLKPQIIDINQADWKYSIFLLVIDR